MKEIKIWKVENVYIALLASMKQAKYFIVEIKIELDGWSLAIIGLIWPDAGRAAHWMLSRTKLVSNICQMWQVATSAVTHKDAPRPHSSSRIDICYLKHFTEHLSQTTINTFETKHFWRKESGNLVIETIPHPSVVFVHLATTIQYSILYPYLV